ncbi:MAG: ergothioneine biosynthesis protein EgtC [Pseudomonadota bacterium]|nr:ergothioneine biosynthesis protein EgtC [Pseudomonadota bacterium]
MCRIAAYLGEDVDLATFLLRPPHSLYRQSWDARELTEARVNADGFGIGWYAPDRQAATYINTSPIWSDPNLDSLGRTLSSGCWLGNVRSATPGLGVSLANTQPFHGANWLFTHNGFVEDFAQALRPRLSRELADDIHAEIKGTTDSEYLFALIRQRMRENPHADPADVMFLAVEALDRWMGQNRCLLNWILTDGQRVFALRDAVGAEAPSLYFCTDSETTPNGQWIASEPLDDSEFWRPIPQGALLILDHDQPPELRAR